MCDHLAQLEILSAALTRIVDLAGAAAIAAGRGLRLEAGELLSRTGDSAAATYGVLPETQARDAAAEAISAAISREHALFLTPTNAPQKKPAKN